LDSLLPAALLDYPILDQIQLLQVKMEMEMEMEIQVDQDRADRMITEARVPLPRLINSRIEA